MSQYKDKNFMIKKLNVLLLIVLFITSLSTKLTSNEPLKLSDEEVFSKMIIEQYSRFVNTLGFFESSNRYYITSPSTTFKGMYQFGPLALKDVHMSHIEDIDFLRNPYYQEIAMFRYMLVNRRYLESHLSYIGETINGIHISEAGLLAGAHLVGYRSTRQYLSSEGEFIPHDGNGTSIERYLKEFESISLDLKYDSTIILDFLFTQAIKFDIKLEDAKQLKNETRTQFLAQI